MHDLVVVGVLASLGDHLGYASGSVATGRVPMLDTLNVREQTKKQSRRGRPTASEADDELTPNGEEGGRDYLNG